MLLNFKNRNFNVNICFKTIRINAITACYVSIYIIVTHINVKKPLQTGRAFCFILLARSLSRHLLTNDI